MMGKHRQRPSVAHCLMDASIVVTSRAPVGAVCQASWVSYDEWKSERQAGRQEEARRGPAMGNGSLDHAYCVLHEV